MNATSALHRFCFALLLQIGFAGAGAAEPRAFLSETGLWPEQPRATPGDVALYGNHAYVTTSAGLKVLDLTDPANPRELGTDDKAGGWLAVSGNHLYCGGQNLWILDLSDPGRPREVGRLGGLSWPRGIEISDGYAYLAGAWQRPDNAFDQAHGLQIVDVRDPAHPVRLGAFTNSPAYAAWAEAVAVSGRHAYLAAGADGLYVLDVSQPATPRRVGRYQANKHAQRVAASGGFAYLSYGSDTLDVVDVTVPENPRRVGGYTAAGGIQQVKIAGNRLYLAVGAIGLEIVDIGDPARPVQVATYQTALLSSWGLSLAAGRAAVVDTLRGFQYLDVADPANPTLLGRLEMGGNAQGVAASGKQVYLADGAFLQVLDAGNAVKPRRIGKLETRGTTRSIALTGRYAVVAETSPDGVEIFDVGEPAQPRRLGRCGAAVDSNARIALSGHHAFVTAGAAGVQVIDFTDPANPKVAAPYRTAATATDLAVSGKYLIAASARQNGDQEFAAMEIVDIGAPAAPKRVKTFGGGEGLAVAVAGKYACLAGRWVEPGLGEENGLHVVDIGDPANAKRVGSFQMPGDWWYSPAGMTLSGNYAMVSSFSGSGEGRIQLFDISDPAAPRRLGSVPMGDPRSLAVEGNSVYAAAGWEGLKVLTLDVYLPRAKITERSTWPARPGDSLADGQVRGRHAYLAGGRGLRIVDIGNPARPVETGFLAIPAAGGVVISGDLAFVSSGWNGWRVVDIGNPDEPRLLAHHDPQSPVSGFYASGNLLYLMQNEDGTGSGGFRIMDIADPLAPRLLGRYPKSVRSMVVRDRFAYLAAGREFEIVDVSNPAQPVKVSGNASDSSFFNDVKLVGDFACLATRFGLEIFHVGDPLQPVRVGGLPIGNCESVAISGSYAAALLGEFVEIIDIRDPANPVRIARQRVPSAGRVTIAGNLACTIGYQGIAMIDLSTPAAPRIAGRYLSQNDTWRSAIEGTVVYSAGVDFRITDFANPAAPEELSRLADEAFPGEGRLEDVAVSEGRAYLTGPGFFVIDIADRRNPKKLARHNPSARYGRLVVNRRHAVTVSYRAGDTWLESLDLTDPGNPVLAGECQLGSFDYRGLGRAGDTVYLAGGDGLQIFDLSNPSVPRLIGEYPASLSEWNPRDVAVSNGYAFLVEAGVGLSVIDVRQPSRPVLVGSMREFERPGFATSIAIAGDYAWLSGFSRVSDSWIDQPGGAQLVDLSNLSEPRPIADYALPQSQDRGFAVSISAHGNLACLALGPGGIKMLDLTTLIPKLRTEKTSGKIRLSWERTENPFQLQHQSAIHGPWRNLAPPPQPASERMEHEAPAGSGTEFFRLVR